MVDGLAVFLKQVFLLATLLAVVGGLARRDAARAPARLEYHLLVLTSLLGMMVLASARELVLLFVAFELMSIPLYVLAGFAKRDARAVEASLKFFLVGSLSTALLVYGLSFVYGVTGSTRLDVVARAVGRRGPAPDPGPRSWSSAGWGSRSPPSRSTCGCRTPTRRRRRRSSRGCRWRRRRPGSPRCSGSSSSAAGPTAVALGAARRRVLGALTIVAGNLMALPQTDAKRLLAYSGIAHIGYMLLGVAAMSPHGVAMMLFYLVAYLFSNMGAFMVVEAVAEAEGSSALRSFRGLAQRSPALALAMLLFLLSLGGIPFVVGFWAKLYVFWAAAQAGLYGLVLLAAVLTVVALFYYLLVAKQMYIDAAGPAHAGARSRRPWPSCSWSAPSRSCCWGSIPGPLARRRAPRGGAAVLTAPSGRRSLLPAPLLVDPALGRLARGARGSTRPAPRTQRPVTHAQRPPSRPSGRRSRRTAARARAAASRPGPAAAGRAPAANAGATDPEASPRAVTRTRSRARLPTVDVSLVPSPVPTGRCRAAFSLARRS